MYNTNQLEFLRPPQAVIYTDDMEPITVVQMRPAYWDFLLKERYMTFAVYFPVEFISCTENHVVLPPFPRVVIRAEPVVNLFNKTKYLILTTADETNVLLMDADYLPGQIRKINEEKKAAFCKGFLNALKSLT